MRRYIIRRLLLTIPTLFLVTVLVFFLIRFIPGDVVDQMVGERAFFTDIDRLTIERNLGLDVPLHVQYGRWIGALRDKDGNFNGIFQGSLGNSLWRKTPVINEITDRIPVTVELGVIALLSLLIVSIPIGIFSAMRQDSIGDYLSRSLATTLVAVPNFWMGLIIVVLALGTCILGVN